MACCSCEGCLKWGALLIVLTALFVSGVQFWLHNKSYVFSADEVAAIATKALKATKGKGHNATFTLAEAELRKKYPNHILPAAHTEWIFMNAGGWMGALYLLHASLTEYVLFFGTAIHTSGHSGRPREGAYNFNESCAPDRRYWANISDTLIEGKYIQWKEGTTYLVTYKPGETIYHYAGEVTAMEWQGHTWMVEYGRGFVPSTLGFALSDTVFGTQDFYLIYKTFRIYTIALFQEFLQGNF